LAGCDEVNHRTDTTEDGERPLGDNLGDDSALHGGDVHIRAGNRVVIKAEQEICLQVGRTVLSLNDQGFTVKSKVTNSNFENVLDATLGLSPRDGINMFGYNVNVSSVKGFQISDSYGGSMTSSIGVVGVNGREIKLAAYDTMEYGFTMLYALFQLIQCSASGGAALGGAEDVNTAQYVNFTFDMVQRIIEVVKNVYEGYQARQKTKEIEDEKKASDRANADLERARTDAKKAAEERDAADKKLKEDAERAADSEQAARKAKEDADAKAKTAQEAAEQERQAKKKHEEDAAAEQKARADKDAADQEAARKKTEADDADQKAKAAKDQADSDAADAAKKKQEADDAQADADKAEKAADVDDKQIKALEERADANEESAADHAAKAAAAGKIVEAQTAILAAMVEQSNAIILKKNELDGLIAEQAGLIKDGKLRGKALAEAEAKLKSLKNELNITLQSEKTLELQITLESAKSHQAGEEVGNERRKAEEAQQSADQKKAEAEEAQRKSDADKAAAKDAQNNADTKKSEAEDAQTKADQSKKDSEDADSASKTSRKDSDDADAAAKKAAEANADAEADAAKSQREAEDAATDRTNKTTAAEEAEAEAAAKQAAKEADEQKLQTDMEKLQNAEDAKEQADADLKAKEKAAEDAQKKYDAAVAATTSSALTDEFDQAVDVEGEKVLYEAPDYQPDPENQGGDGKSNEGGKNNDDVI
jgi:hypothetical protein